VASCGARSTRALIINIGSQLRRQDGTPRCFRVARDSGTIAKPMCVDAQQARFAKPSLRQIRTSRPEPKPTSRNLGCRILPRLVASVRTHKRTGEGGLHAIVAIDLAFTCLRVRTLRTTAYDNGSGESGGAISLGFRHRRLSLLHSHGRGRPGFCGVLQWHDPCTR